MDVVHSTKEEATDEMMLNSKDKGWIEDRLREARSDVQARQIRKARVVLVFGLVFAVVAVLVVVAV